jgi:uncharacterized protein YlxP (DUF503 family)
MIVGVLTIDVAIFEARSLKDKRRVIQSVKEKIHNRFNVAVAEVAHGDSAKQCRLGIATVSNESRQVHSVLDNIVDLVRNVRGLTLLDYDRRLL